MTGTDTDVGKTWVSEQMLQAWRAGGLRVAGLKAAESGCARDSAGRLVGSDDGKLFAAAGNWQPERCRFLFEPAIAPGVAADDERRAIDFATIEGQISVLRDAADRILVEGAGGWLVPMGGGRTIEDLAVALRLDVLIVARAGLGTINHSALTARAVAAAGLRVAGIVISRRPSDDEVFARRNADEIARIAGVPVVVVDGIASAADGLSRLGL